MRVVILQTVHPPLDKRMHYKVARSLAAAGHWVISIGPPADDDAPEQGVPDEEGVIIHDPLPRGLSRFKRWRMLIKKGIRAKGDVYVCPELDSWIACWLVKLATRRPIVFDVHEYTPNHIAKLLPNFIRPPVRWLTIKLLRFLARRSDLLIFTRETLQREYEGIDTPKVVVLNTNHLQPRCTKIPDALRERYGKRPTIIHQGIFGTIRGSFKLLDALQLVVREVPDILCICLGRYVYGSEQQFLRAISAAQLDANVEVIPEVPFDQVPAYVAVSRLGLILFQPIGLGHTLGLPHKLFDYMREGIPVLAPDFCVEIKKILLESDCGVLVDSTNPRSIASGILRLVTNPNSAAEMGRNARRAVEESYNWQNEERKLLAGFAMLERRGKGKP